MRILILELELITIDENVLVNNTSKEIKENFKENKNVIIAGKFVLKL